LRVGDGHHRLEPAQIAVGAPILGELDAGAGELAWMRSSLPSSRSKRAKASAGGTGEAGDDGAGAEAAQLPGVGLDDGIAHRDLAVAGDDDLAALAQADDRRAVPDRADALAVSWDMDTCG